MNYTKLCMQNPKYLKKYFNGIIIRRYSDAVENAIDDASPGNGVPEMEREIEYAETKLNPLMDMKYADQLNLKERHACMFLNTFKMKLEAINAPDQLWASNLYPGLPCPLQAIIPSPQIYNYRNRTSFRIGRGWDGNMKKIGPSSTLKDGLLYIDPYKFPEDRSTSHRRFVDSFQKYLDESRYDAFASSKGVWRSVDLISNAADEMMAMVHTTARHITKTEETELDQSLVDYFFKGPGSEAGLTSLFRKSYYHTRDAPGAPKNLLFGKARLSQKCAGLQFSSTPGEDIPINIPATEKLLEEVKKIVEPTARTTVLEINPSTNFGGLFSLALADSVRACLFIGADLNLDSTQHNNFGENAKANNISNVSFIMGAPNKIIPQMSSNLSKLHDVIAVMEMPQSYNNKSLKCLHMLRSHPFIDRVLLVCEMDANPASKCSKRLIERLAPLATCEEDEILSNHPPLLPRYAFTLDHLPHTYRFKLGVLLQRHT